jgi:hypothetical protein
MATVHLVPVDFMTIDAINILNDLITYRNGLSSSLNPNPNPNPNLSPNPNPNNVPSPDPNGDFDPNPSSNSRLRYSNKKTAVDLFIGE